jgi:two-component system nitrate/nitrite response regulator NarL
MKIVLCSTRDSVRERWRSLLQKHNYSVYQASSPQVLQPLVQKNEQYLLLIDQLFTDFQTINTLCQKSDVLRIFVLSDNPGKEDGIKLMQIGVVGYANTYISEGRLAEAVKTVQTGRVWFNQDVLAQFIQHVNTNKKDTVTDDSKRILEGLTEREREIAILVSQGLSNQEIGKALYISDRTVKSHLTTIFNKTGVNNRLKLALVLHGHD